MVGSYYKTTINAKFPRYGTPRWTHEKLPTITRSLPTYMVSHDYVDPHSGIGKAMD